MERAPCDLEHEKKMSMLNASFDDVYQRMIILIDRNAVETTDKINALKELISSKMEGTEKALQVKTVEMERRLEGLNQLRADVVADRAMYVRNDVYDSKHSLLLNDMNNLSNRMSVQETNRVAVESKLVMMSKLQEEVNSGRDIYLKAETYLIKTKYYDEFVSDMKDRVTKIETRSVTWTAAIGFFFVIVQFVLHFIGTGSIK